MRAQPTLAYGTKTPRDELPIPDHLNRSKPTTWTRTLYEIDHTAMAEVFGAVASGVGLVSLALQLVDSAQKLKKLYNTTRDAPTTVADLCFELETMSLSLRQLNSHRNTKSYLVDASLPVPVW
jgi:hypothetical protein